MSQWPFLPCGFLNLAVPSFLPSLDQGGLVPITICFQFYRLVSYFLEWAMCFVLNVHDVHHLVGKRENHNFPNMTLVDWVAFNTEGAAVTQWEFGPQFTAALVR